MGNDLRNRRILRIKNQVGPSSQPCANPLNAKFKTLLKAPERSADGMLSQSDLDNLSKEEQELLIHTFRMMPRQLRKKMLAKAGIRIVVE